MTETAILLLRSFVVIRHVQQESTLFAVIKRLGCTHKIVGIPINIVFTLDRGLC